MAIERSTPYVYVTWITKLLAAEDYCEWKVWFQSHYTKYPTVPSDFNLTEWTAQHTELTEKRVESLRAEGYDIYVENQNYFNLEGKTGITLGGKPDIVAVKGDTALVVDCKTGNSRHSDNYQVMIYMLILPSVHNACRGKVMKGEVQYLSDKVEIPSEKVNDDFRQKFGALMKKVGGDVELERNPTYSECRFCKITDENCPDRVTEEPVHSTNLF